MIKFFTEQICHLLIPGFVLDSILNSDLTDSNKEKILGVSMDNILENVKYI